jgi:hypothetical protein
MFPSPRQILVTSLISACYLIGQLLTQTDLQVAGMFSIAIFFGVLSVFVGGGIASAAGCLNGILISKFLLIGLAIKILMLQPADIPLSSPRTTACVMALGFFGLCLGTLLQANLACPRSLSLNRPLSDQMLLSFAIVFFVLSYAGYFASNRAADDVVTGGWAGPAHIFGSLKSLSIVPPMLYLWKIQTPRWMTHPMMLAILAFSAMVGVFSTGKQESMEPLIFYVLLGFLRYGWTNIRLWSLVATGLTYYALIIFPYSQYVRHSGGREGSISERVAATKDAFWQILTDPEFRNGANDKANQGVYFDSSLAAFNRLAMVGEADKLIFATEQQQAFTGWETIVWGFKLLAPSFLYHDKPIFGAGNYLSHIVGESNPKDLTTQVSYGIMANFYNAFSFAGVVVGTLIFFAGFYYWMRTFFGNPRCAGPESSTLWFFWLVALYEHSLIESSVSGIISSLTLPGLVALIWIAAKWVCPLLPESQQAEELPTAA